MLGCGLPRREQDAVCGEVLLWRGDLGGEVAIGAIRESRAISQARSRVVDWSGGACVGGGRGGGVHVGVSRRVRVL